MEVVVSWSSLVCWLSTKMRKEMTWKNLTLRWRSKNENSEHESVNFQHTNNIIYDFFLDTWIWPILHWSMITQLPPCYYLSVHWPKFHNTLNFYKNGSDPISWCPRVPYSLLYMLYSIMRLDQIQYHGVLECPWTYIPITHSNYFQCGIIISNTCVYQG